MFRYQMLSIWCLVFTFVGCGESTFVTQPCHVEKVDNTTFVTCPDGSSSEIKDGAVGPQGNPGVNGNNAILEVIDPCGDNPHQIDEVILKANGILLTYIESNKYRFLGVLTPGTYITKDKQLCKYIVTEDMEVRW